MVPGAQAFWIRLNDLLGRGYQRHFAGWGMTTTAFPPWYQQGDRGDRDLIAEKFFTANQQLVSKVEDGTFCLSALHNIQDKIAFLQELMFRHYYVFWSARYAAAATRCSVKNIVECGVCDGMSVYFAMKALRDGAPFKAFLYDAFEGMKREYLLESEKATAGRYSNLTIDIPKSNLAGFSEYTTFCQGFIPESFSRHVNPADLVWLHIDLNSSLPTTAALEYFFDRIERGGIVLFDDYASPEFFDTKLAVDRFLTDKRGVLMPLPTGQALYFKL